MSGDPQPPSPRVRAVEHTDSSGLRLRVRFDDDSELEIALEVWLRASLRVGDPLGEAERARLTDRDLAWRAREAALTLLAHRPRSREELRRSLTRKGFRGEVLAACLAALEADGLLDDDAFARSFVRDRLRLRPRGSRRLASELGEKGVERGAVERAIEQVFSEETVSEDTLAESAALAWLKRQGAAVRDALAQSGRSPERERATRRLAGFLARRGFSGDAARDAMRVASEAARANPGAGA